MAGKSLSGDGLASSLAGMSKSQLYDIMCQMKTLIEQNQPQARHILIDNPLLTRALFQAQIMLGMVQPPQAIPNVLPQEPQQTPQQVQQSPQISIPADQSLPSQGGLNDPRNVSQVPVPFRKQQQYQSPMPASSPSAQGFHSQSMASHPLQPPKGHVNAQGASIPLPQTSQPPHMPSLPIHSGSQPPPVHQPPMPPMSSHQQQQPMQATGISHLPLQPPLPPQPRQPAMPLPHQMQSHMGPNMNFQHPGIPSSHHSQPMYHSNIKPQSGMGSPFTHGQPSHPSQLPQSMYQGGGSHLGTDFNNQAGNTMQMERGSQWPPAPPEHGSGSQHSGSPAMGPPQAGISNQPARPPTLTPEMEQALLQQVMSLTPEQINLLPPEQRQQVLQLQQMLRQ